MKSKQEIEDKISDLKIDKAIIEENNYQPTESEVLEIDYLLDQISLLYWVLK